MKGAIQEKLLDYFRRVSLPGTAFQFSSRYLSGVFTSPKEKKLKAQFVAPLEKGVVLPSFYKKNIQDAASLGKSLGQGFSQLGAKGSKVVFLLPELSQKVFIFTFASLPNALEEKEELIRFRIKKQMPLLPRDARLAFQVQQAGDQKRVVSAVAKAAVVREYEELFQHLKCKVALTGIPSLSLLSLMAPSQEKDYILLDVEDDFFSLVAVIDAKAVLYRQKHLGAHAGGGEEGGAAKADDILVEVANTLQFIEDKENKRLASVWLRLGVLQPGDSFFQRMQEQLTIPLKRVESLLPDQGGPSDNQRILSPLLGQIA